MRSDPLRPGLALAATLVIAYTACAAIFWLLPDAAMGFMASLFHGVDFRKLQPGTAFTFGSFAYALCGLAIWGFLVGALFGLIHQALGREAR